MSNKKPHLRAAGVASAGIVRSPFDDGIDYGIDKVEEQRLRAQMDSLTMEKMRAMIDAQSNRGVFDKSMSATDARLRDLEHVYRREVEERRSIQDDRARIGDDLRAAQEHIHRLRAMLEFVELQHPGTIAEYERYAAVSERLRQSTEPRR